MTSARGEGSSNRMRNLTAGAINLARRLPLLRRCFPRHEVTVDGPGSLWQLNAADIGKVGRSTSYSDQWRIGLLRRHLLHRLRLNRHGIAIVVSARFHFRFRHCIFGQAARASAVGFGRRRRDLSGRVAAWCRNTLINEILIEAPLAVPRDADINAMYDTLTIIG
jgi:hypothetical protein